MSPLHNLCKLSLRMLDYSTSGMTSETLRYNFERSCVVYCIHTQCSALKD